MSQLEKVKCHKIDSSADWKLNQYKINTKNGECLNNCTNDVEYEYNGKCYGNCSNGYYINNTKKIYKCELEKCFLCPPIALQKHLCSKCNINYYPKENDPLNIGEYFNCYKEPEGYYLDTNVYLYKKIYHECENCNTKDNIESEISNKNNIEIFCDNNKPFKNNIIHECVRNCSINNIINKICILNYKINSIEEFIKVQDILLENIETGLVSKEYNTLNLENGQDNIIENDKMKITLTTIENQKNNKNNNITSIDLGECETKLRRYYNISDNEKLFMKKIDVIQEGMKIPKIEYDVYAKLNGTNLKN